MKTQSLILSLLVLSLARTVPASAQNTLQYSPLLQKRADLRLQWAHAQRKAAEAAKNTQRSDTPSEVSLQRDRAGQIIIPAQGNPYLLDYHILSNRQPDLRLAWMRDGLNIAFTNWLRRERPHAYLQYIREATKTR
jgi:hypothetical protein